MKNNIAINDGFPIGMCKKDLVAGCVVEILHNQTPIVGLVVSVTSYSQFYMFERDFVLLCLKTKILMDCVHTQIKRLVTDDIVNYLP